MTEVVLVACVVVVLVGVGLLGAYVVRRQALDRRIGSFVCAVRLGEQGWVRGWAQYGVGRLDWYRRRSLSVRPARSWPRSELVVVDRTEVPGGEDGGPVLQLTCRCGEETVEMRLSTDAGAGLTSWLEAVPPQSISTVL